MDEKNVFSQMDFGPLTEFLEDDDVTDISYSNGGQVWLKTLSKGIYQVERPDINNPFMEKLAFQCANVMGRTFNMAHPFLDAESAELRMNFVHESIATNGVACLMRKTPAKIRLNKTCEQKHEQVLIIIASYLYLVQNLLTPLFDLDNMLKKIYDTPLIMNLFYSLMKVIVSRFQYMELRI